MQLIDIHTHIKNPENLQILDIGIDVEKIDENTFFSTGIHPKFFNINTLDEDLEKLEKLCNNKNCLAIGETGLDCSAENYDVQKQIFQRQIIIAQKFSKPLIIHCVRAYNDIIFFIKKYKLINPIVFHGYNGNSQTTNNLLNYPQVFFSFSDRFMHLPKTSEQIKKIPIEKIFIETDNNPQSNLYEILKRISQIKNVDETEFANQMMKNFEKITSFSLNNR